MKKMFRNIRFSVLLGILTFSSTLVAQDVYFNANAAAYSYGYSYKADYPFDLKKYTHYSPSTNFYIGGGYSVYQQHYFEVGYSRIAYRYHFPNANNLQPQTCTCLSGPGFSYIRNDAKSATNFYLSYKYGFLIPRQVDARRGLQLFGVVGIIGQFNPKKEPGVFANTEEEFTVNGTIVSVVHNRVEGFRPLIRLGVEAERRLLGGLYLTTSFSQYIGFAPQMSSTTSFSKGGVTYSGVREARGVGRNFTLGVRYYAPYNAVKARGRTSDQFNSGYFYFGVDRSRFRNRQKIIGDGYYYRNRKIDRENELMQGLVVGYRKSSSSYETGFHLLSSIIGYSLEPGPFLSSINYTSHTYLYVPLRYKHAIHLGAEREKHFVELMPTAAVSFSFYLPPNVKSNTITFNSPNQTFQESNLIFGTELGAELNWHTGRFTLSGYSRYLLSFGKSRSVDFDGNIAGRSVSGSVKATATGLNNGFSIRYNFIKNL